MRLFLAFTFLLLLSATPAYAADSEYYGQFLPEGQNIEVFSNDIDSFNDDTLSEQTSFACLTEDGQQISPEESETLSKIFLAASDVYGGEFSFSAGEQLEPGQRPPDNGGYQTGSSGMQSFLATEQQLLSSGKWVDYSFRSLERGRSPQALSSDSPGWFIAFQADSVGTNKTQGTKIASLINTDALNPLQLTADLPPACAISPIDPTSPDIGELFSDSGNFFMNMLLYTPAKLASSAYDFLQPYAFRYTFFTPHSEKGDLFWDTPANCSPSASSSGCRNASPLGFDGSTSSTADSAWFLSAAQFVQWLISGLYFLVLFIAAALYIVRGNRATSLRLMELLPRLFGSVVLTVMAGFLIGALITFSNLLVQSTFEFTGTEAIGNVNTFLLQAGNIIGGPESLQTLTSLVIGALTAFFYLIFVLAAVGRQLLLVGALILAPLAAFSILVPAWANAFRVYLRGLMAIIFLPVFLAFILVVGMSINPLAQNPEASYGQIQGALGLILMMVTLWLMYKVIFLCKDYVLTGSISLRKSDDGKASAREAIGERLAAGREKAAELIPEGRGVGASAVSAEVKSLPGSGGGGSAGLSAPGSALAAGGSVASDNPAAAMRSFQNQKQQALGQRITPAQARSYRNGLRQALAAQQANKNRFLKPEEVAKMKSRYAEKHGGSLLKQNGKWYLSPAEPLGHQGVTPE